MHSSKIILQQPSSTETRTVLSACMLNDHPVTHSSLAGLAGHKQVLTSGAMPVGSVEFVREAMQVAGIAEPANMSYPRGCQPWLYRRIGTRLAGDVLGTCFVKPCATKAFTGFVYDPLADPDSLSEHDAEQHAAFMALPATELVYVSEPVEFVSEWRYYVMDGAIVGQARYDPAGAEDAPQPALGDLRSCIAALAIGHPYAADFGVLSTGETALVECNDAWAIGLYGKCMSSEQYLQFLQARWRTLKTV